MVFDIFLTLFLVFLNGFFVAAEFAIVKVRISQLEIKAGSGHAASKAALTVVKKLDAYLSATQLGITLASLGLGWIGESVVADIIISIFNLLNIGINPEDAHQIAFPVAFFVITVLHIVFGELAPKTIAIQRPESVTTSVTYPLQLFYFVFRPFIWMLNKFAGFILKIIGFGGVDAHETHSAEELQYLIEQSKTSGAFKPEQHELIQNVFHFTQITARQVMVPRTGITAIDVDLNEEEIISMIIREGYSRMPVYKDSIDNIIGVAYIKDLLKMIGRQEKFDLNRAIRPPYYVPHTKKINELLKELQDKHMHMAIITDEFGGVAGIVTIEDILEELVGEIQDEHDEEAPIVEKVKDREYIVNALSSIDDVNEYLPVEIPRSTSYETVAGFVNSVFDRIPEIYEKVDAGEYEVVVLKKSKQSVLVVKLIYKGQ
jgi:CBS domain containing-hemolysin-like protein